MWCVSSVIEHKIRLSVEKQVVLLSLICGKIGILWGKIEAEGLSVGDKSLMKESF